MDRFRGLCHHAWRKFEVTTFSTRHCPDACVLVCGLSANLAGDRHRARSPIRIRQQKCPDKLVEHDHRAIERRICSIMNFNTFSCVRIIPSSVEVMHMIKKGQMKENCKHQTSA